jgi:hypothetical protein
MLVLKRRMNTKKNLAKGTTLAKGPPTFCNFLKIIVKKMLLKTFSMSTYIMTQSRCRSRRALMSKGMASQPSKVDTLN